MMLPGYALAAQGTQIHVATWPFGNAGHLLSPAFAQQANCYLIAVGAAWTEEATPEVLKGLEPIVTSDLYYETVADRELGWLSPDHDIVGRDRTGQIGPSECPNSSHQQSSRS
jgi:hypothetical protein